MTSFEIIYEQFLSTSSVSFGELTDEEIKKDLFNWTLLASSKFKFPRIDLAYEMVDSDDGQEKKPFFKENLTQKEITVIVEHMSSIAISMQLTAASARDDLYQDANLKLPSQTGRITQLNRALENQIAKAKKTENDYYRSIDNKPTIGEIWTI